MAVKDHVVLSSDGGSVTMGRRLAFYSYGKFDVVIPDGREQQVDDDRIQNGYIARNPGQQMGRFDFGFIRQDATINLEAQTSDLELAIDSTEKRSEGDVYVERDISRAGMNGFELGRDFNLDDIVSYRVWGNYLRLPVTAGDLESSVDGGLRGVRLHVGGQVASDSEARRRANNEILGQIENEKRQRLKDVGVVSRAASRAQSAADSAQSTADSAAADARDALSAVGDANGVIQRHVEAARDASAASVEASERSLAASTSSVQASTRSSLASEAATEAKELSQEAMRAAEVARNEAEQGRNAAEIERMHAEEARSAAEKERQAAFEHRQEAQVAEREASKARHDSLAIQQFYTQGGLGVHRNLILWNRERRTRLYSHVGSGTSTHEDLLQTSDWNEQRGFTFRAPGTWAGRVQIQIEFQNSITGDKAVDMYTYGVGPGNREEKYKQGAVHMRFVKAQVQVEVWLPNNPVFVVQVDPDTGDCIPNTAYDSMLLKPLTFTSDGGVQCYFKAEAPSDRARLGSDGRTFYAKKMNIPGTDIEVWPPYFELKP